MKNIKEIKKSVEQWIVGSPTIKTLLQYSVFVFISFLFWAFISLNNNIQVDLEVPVKITSIPDSTTIISDMPELISINVRDKGMPLLKFMVGKRPTLNIDFNDYAMSDGHFFVPNVELRKKIRGLFENSTTIQSMSLESLNLKYTNLPAKKVPIKLDLDVRPNIQYTIYGDVKQSVDSALIYSDRNTLALINDVYTTRVEERELTDTLSRIVAINPIQGTKIIPDKVELTIPVEALIVKKNKIPVMVKNTPMNENVITFPSEVEVSFLVPFSMYRKVISMEAIADYKDIEVTKSNKIGIKIENLPELYSNISLTQDSVEFIIEKH